MFLTPWIQHIHAPCNDKLSFRVILWIFILSSVQFYIFAWVSNSDKRPSYVSWIINLGVFSMKIDEPMFQFLCHFDIFWLGFESLKVGSLLLSCWCKLFRILGGPVWLVITLTQLTKMRKFLLNCILEARDFLCFNFEIMKNPFDQFLNAIPNAICNFLLVSSFADLSRPMFVMSLLEIYDR